MMAIHFFFFFYVLARRAASCSRPPGSAGRRPSAPDRCRGAVAVVAARLPDMGVDVRMEVEVQQRVRLRVDDDTILPPLPAVAAVGSAEQLKLFPVHRGAASTAVACAGMDVDAVDEPGHRQDPSIWVKQRCAIHLRLRSEFTRVEVLGALGAQD